MSSHQFRIHVLKAALCIIRPLVIGLLFLHNFITPGLAQTVSIPDPGLNAAIRDALQKPTGPLSVQDLLALTHLDARLRNIRSVEGLEAAGNLSALVLSQNLLT